MPVYLRRRRAFEFQVQCLLLIGALVTSMGCTDDTPPGPPDTAGDASPQDDDAQPADSANYVPQNNPELGPYNCDQLDVCTEDDFNYRLACAECDPRYGNPPQPGQCQLPCVAAADCAPGEACVNGTCEIDENNGPVEVREFPKVTLWDRVDKRGAHHRVWR